MPFLQKPTTTTAFTRIFEELKAVASAVVNFTVTNFAKIEFKE